MCLYNPFYKGKSQPCIAASWIAGGIHPVKALPDTLEIFPGDADPVIGNAAHGEIILDRESKLYKTAGAAILNGIFQQIQKYTDQACLIAL